MLFFSISNVDIQFAKIKKPIHRNHTAAMALVTIKKLELIDKKEYVASVLDKKAEIFVIHKAALLPTNIYPSKKTQIKILIAKEISTQVLAEYLDYSDLFLLDLAIELSKHIRINNPTINCLKKKNHLIAQSII